MIALMDFYRIFTLLSPYTIWMVAANGLLSESLFSQDVAALFFAPMWQPFHI